MRNVKRRLLPKAVINVTPFIDILLVLLVIFMTITPTTPEGFDTRVPQQPPPGPRAASNDDAIVLSLDRLGTLRINQKTVELGTLTQELSNIFRTRNDKTVFIQADSNLNFADVSQLIDAAKSGGVDRFGLMTETISARRTPSVIKGSTGPEGRHSVAPAARPG